MELTFDLAKDAANIRKHGISLARASDFNFDTARYDLDDSQAYGEQRWNLIGWLDARLYALTVAFGETSTRAISLRKAEKQSTHAMPKDTEAVIAAHGVPDAENPEWTEERFDRSLGFSKLPEPLRVKLSAIQEASRRRRGVQKLRPTKQPVTMRLSADVLAVLRGKGQGWQTLVDDTLREHFVTGPAKRS